MSDFRAQSLPLLQTLPAPLAALLMQQVMREEVMFPRERNELAATLSSLRPPRSAEMDRAVSAFAALRMPTGMDGLDWRKDPAGWVERFTAEMWSSGQIEAYRNAAKVAIQTAPQPATNRLARGVVVVYDGQLRAPGGAESLFRRLRTAGTLFASVQAPDGWADLGAWMGQRVREDREAYSSWYLSGDDGARSMPNAPAVTTLTYTSLQPARRRLLQKMNDARNARASGGPEGLRRSMQDLTADEIGLPPGSDPVLRSFATDVLVGGSGTQLYATTFVQWSAREVLRRAQPQTLIARFTARNQSTSMDMRLAQPMEEPPLDFGGSLMDAEMGAHLTYVNMLRLPGAERAHFLAWHEGYGQAVLVGGNAAADARHAAPIQLAELLRQMA